MGSIRQSQRAHSPQANAGRRFVAFMASGLSLMLATSAFSQDKPKVQIALAKTTVFVGEPISLRLQVATQNRIPAPDLGELKDFKVTLNGTSQNSGSSVVYINGKLVKSGNQEFIFDYSLIARRAGTLQFPSVEVLVDGQKHRTNPLTIASRPFPEQADFKLQLKIPRQTGYVGEPLELELAFLYKNGVRRLSQTLSPFSRITADFHLHTSDQGKGVQGMPVTLNGQQFNSRVYKLIAIPKKAGVFPLDTATMLFEGVSGYQNVQDRFTRQITKQPRYAGMLVTSKPSQLTIRELPEKGRPPHFDGHIGQYQITATAAPLEVNVGDPITLTVALSGPPYLEHVNLPSLGKQAGLTKFFKIPTERESGKIEGTRKTFTQTIRALNEEVAEIPPIELAYFDTATGAYQIAKSQPIQIKVNATRIVTANDAEGRTPVGQTSELKALNEGIAHNYEGLDALADHRSGPQVWLRSPASMATIVGPPLAYFALFFLLSTLRRRNADPLAVRSRKAMAELSRQLEGADSSDSVLEAFRGFLGGKLRLASGALTFKDIEAPLSAKGVDGDTITAIGKIFEKCEVSRYAGASNAAKPESLTQECLTLARSIEAQLK